MNNRLVWFVKNTKIYKRLRSVVLALNNSYKLEVSPSLLFLLQHINGHFNRYDIIVRYLAIEDLQRAGNSGIDMYNKMQSARNTFLASKNKNIKSEDLQTNKDGTLQNLVDSFSAEGFNFKFPLSVNSNLQLVDGSHRLACAMYFKQKAITLKKSEVMEVNYDLDWFTRYFEPEEIGKIQSKYRELMAAVNLKEVLTDILSGENQFFGRGEFYQSCEEIDMPGQRPTTERYDTYRLDTHLTSDQDVLDIGCNCGFFTLKIAKKVRSATGVEISDSLVQIAQATQAYLGRTNVYFNKGNFNKMKFNRKFDFIFSFAVHHWLGADMKKFGRRLHSMLKADGKILLESQNIHKEDQDWDEKVARFEEAGFEEIENGQLKDDGVIERRFCLFQKVEL